MGDFKHHCAVSRGRKIEVFYRLASHTCQGQLGDGHLSPFGMLVTQNVRRVSGHY